MALESIFISKPLNSEMHLQLRFVLSDGLQPVEELQKNIQLLVLKNQITRQFRYGDFMADFAAKTVLEPTVLLLEKSNWRGISYASRPGKRQPNAFCFPGYGCL